jgi:hypothetical protein
MIDLPAWLEAGSPMRLCECCAVLLAIATAFVIPNQHEWPFKPLESRFKRLACRPALSLLVIAAAPVLLRLALLPLLGAPQPGVHDEFSNLLGRTRFCMVG